MVVIQQRVNREKPKEVEGEKGKDTAEKKEKKQSRRFAVRAPISGMRTRHAALCLLLTVFSTSCVSSLDRTIHAEWTGDASKPTSIAMDVLPSNHVYVPGVVTGHETKMLVDTGAGITVLDNAFARKLGLRRVGSVTVSGVGGKDSGRYVRVPTIRVGDLILRNVLAIALDLTPIARSINQTEAALDNL